MPRWLTRGVRDDEEDDDVAADDVTSYTNHQQLESMVSDTLRWAWKHGGSLNKLSRAEIRNVHGHEN